jgi:hypothetical protein
MDTIMSQDSCWDIKKGRLAKKFQNWGDVYVIKFQIVVTKMPTSLWTSVFHLTGTNENCCDHGDRIPAFWINSNGYFSIESSVNNNGNYWKHIPIELGKTYQVTIQQVKDGKKYWYEIIINGDSKLKVENKKPLTFSNVDLYGSDPWHHSFSSDFGSFCNVEINRERGKFWLFLHFQPVWSFPHQKLHFETI